MFYEGCPSVPHIARNEIDLLLLVDLDDDVLLALMQKLPCKLVRGRLLLVSRRFLQLASSSAALGCHVDVAFLAESKKQPITPLLQALAKLNRDGGITSVSLGNHAWGKGTTKKLIKLFPALEAVDLGSSKKVAHQHGLCDWSAAAIPSLRKFKWRWAFDCYDYHMLNLIRGRELLEELDVANAEGTGFCSGLTDAVLIALGANCPQLRTLCLQGDLRMSDQGIYALLEGCPALSTLELRTRCIFQSHTAHVTLSNGCVDVLTARGLVTKEANAQHGGSLLRWVSN